MQYLLDVPYTGLALNWILIFLEVCVGVLWIDTPPCPLPIAGIDKV